MQKQKQIVVYHKNCLDGFGAALAVKKLLDGEIEFYPLDYSDRENFLVTVDLKDAKVFVVDFSFNKTQTDFIIDTCAEFTWFDHHESAYKEHRYDFNYPVMDVTDKTLIKLSPNKKSGAYLTWENLIGEIPPLIAHIDDRDRWKFSLPNTKEICLALSELLQDFSLWEKYLYNTEPLKQNGKVIQNYYDTQLSRAIEATKEYCNILGVEGLCCNLPPVFASEAGNTLAKESGTFGATWFKDKDGNIKWSLRSIGDFNVAELAAKFGGGGHKNAAGFVLTPASGETVSGVKLWHT